MFVANAGNVYVQTPTSNTHIHIEEIQVAVSYKHMMERSSQRYIKLKDTFIHNLHSLEEEKKKKETTNTHC